MEPATKEKQKTPIPESEQVEDWISHGNWLVTISGRHTAEKNGYQLYLMHPQAELKQWRDELGALVEKAEADTLAVLSDEQKDKFAEMKGKEFEFAFRRGSGLPVDGKRPLPASD